MARLPVTKIKVRNRYRKKLGDIESLAAKELGLLHPIVVRPDGRLIAGERRLAACKRLGMKSVPVTCVDLKEVVRGEFAENAFRKDFLPSEIEAIRRAIEPYERAAAKERQRRHGETAPGRRKHPGQVSPSDGRPETELERLPEFPAAVSRKYRPSSKRRSSGRDFVHLSLRWTETVEAVLGRPPAWQPVYDRHDARDPLKSPAVECGAIRAARSC